MAETGPSPIDDLRQVAAQLRTGVLGEVGLRHADRLDRYLEHAAKGVTIEQALVLSVGPGGSPWWVEADRRLRNCFLSEFKRRFCRSHDAAAELGIAMRRYETSSWKRDQRAEKMPQNYPRTPNELLYLAYRANESVAPGRMPTSERQLRDILASVWAEKEKRGDEIPPIARREPGEFSETRTRGTNVGKENSIPLERRRRGGRP